MITSVLVPPIRVPRRLTTGWLINQHCGDIELGGYLSNAGVPVSLVLDLRVAHDRVASSADSALNGHLRFLCPLFSVLFSTDLNHTDEKTFRCV